MRVVAIAAFHLAFQDRVAGLFTYLGLYVPMACEADGELVYGGTPGMNGVTGGTRHVIGRMPSHVPIDQFFCAGVAFQAFGTQILGGAAGTLGERNDVLLGGIIQMLVRRPMAGLAVMGPAPDPGMEGGIEIGRCHFMTVGTNLASGGFSQRRSAD